VSAGTVLVDTQSQRLADLNTCILGTGRYCASPGVWLRLRLSMASAHKCTLLWMSRALEHVSFYGMLPYPS